VERKQTNQEALEWWRTGFKLRFSKLNMSRIGLAFAVLAVGHSLDFYVSTSGSDSNDGSVNAPWATPFPAVGAIAAAKTGGVLPSSVVVHIASGTYFLGQTLNITAAAGGRCSKESGSRGYLSPSRVRCSPAKPL
jgi:hypothetical protein